MDGWGPYALFWMMAAVHGFAYVYLMKRIMVRPGSVVKKAFGAINPVNMMGAKTLEGLRFAPKLKKVEVEKDA